MSLVDRLGLVDRLALQILHDLMLKVRTDEYLDQIEEIVCETMDIAPHDGDMTEKSMDEFEYACDAVEHKVMTSVSQALRELYTNPEHTSNKVTKAYRQQALEEAAQT